MIDFCYLGVSLVKMSSCIEMPNIEDFIKKNINNNNNNNNVINNINDNNNINYIL